MKIKKYSVRKIKKLSTFNFRLSTRKGQSLVELLIVMALAAILLPAFLGAIMASRQGKPQQGQRVQAIALLKETEKAVKSVRNNDWTTFATFSGTLHPVIYGSQWSLAQGVATTSGFTQQVVISDVYRNTSGAIVTSGGTKDPSTKKIDSTISWTQPRASSITSTFYLARTVNTIKTYTLQSDFGTGSASGTVVASSSGGAATEGEVELGAGGGGGDWCQPTKSISTVDLPKSGVANAITAINGTSNDESVIFAGTGDNASGVSFAKVDIPGQPPSPSTTATFDGYKTNAVFGEANYAYLGTDNNAKEVVIISLTQYSDSPTNSKYLEIGSINLPSNQNANSIYVVNNKAYILGSDNYLYIYDITTRTHAYGTSDYSGRVSLSGSGKKIIVNGNYAYILTGATINQFQIVDVSNASSPSIVGQRTLGSSQAGIDMYISTQTATPTRAYVVTALSGTNSNFFIIDVTTKTNPVVVTGYQGYYTNGMTPKGVTITTGNRAIVVGTGGTEQYQVINISTETSPTKCAGLSYGTGVNGVAAVLQPNGYAYAYIITGDASSELKIILGGAGGQHATSGTYESAPYDATTSAAFNKFSATVSQPSSTTLKIQVAVRSAVNGSCPSTASSYTYLGPNGDANAYFTPNVASISGVIPFGTYAGNYQNPERCFRYKAWFDTTDVSQTPVLYDMIVNYSQ